MKNWITSEREAIQALAILFRHMAFQARNHADFSIADAYDSLEYACSTSETVSQLYLILEAERVRIFAANALKAHDTAVAMIIQVLGPPQA